MTESGIKDINKLEHKKYEQILKFHTIKSIYRIKQDHEYSELNQTKLKVPRGRMLGPFKCLLFTYEIPEIKTVKMTTFSLVLLNNAASH